MLHPSVRVKKSKIQGTGLNATAFIPKDTVVWKLDTHEKQLTLEELQKLSPKRQKLAYQYKDKYIIVSDGSEYMNHSCDPNTWFQGDETLIARRDILPGDEVTYDYATAEIDAGFRASWQCYCGSKKCRKIIKPDDCLNPEFQEMYRGHLPSWVKRYIRKSKSVE